MIGSSDVSQSYIIIEIGTKKNNKIKLKHKKHTKCYINTKYKLQQLIDMNKYTVF